MSDNEKFEVSTDWSDSAQINLNKYNEWYEKSFSDNQDFWNEHGKRIEWVKPYTKVKDVSFNKDNFSIKWYEDGSLNASVNCIDRHLKDKGDQTAIIWEGDDPKDSKHISYNELHKEVSKLANGMKSLGVKKGDRVTIYMPMIPEAAYAMLACTRIGAIHSVVFGGFSPDSLAGRISDCESDIVITADEGLRGGKPIPLKKNTDDAINISGGVRHCIVVKRTGGTIDWDENRDVWYHELLSDASDDCPPEEMNAEDPLFILYTSGSTGKPKAIWHSYISYLVYAHYTFKKYFSIS